MKKHKIKEMILNRIVKGSLKKAKKWPSIFRSKPHNCVTGSQHLFRSFATNETIFDKILSKELPSKAVYEDEKVQITMTDSICFSLFLSDLCF